MPTNELDSTIHIFLMCKAVDSYAMLEPHGSNEVNQFVAYVFALIINFQDSF